MIRTIKGRTAFEIRKYKLPDHRGDSAYASWTKESLVYEEKAAKILNKLRGEKK